MKLNVRLTQCHVFVVMRVKMRSRFTTVHVPMH